MASNSFNCINTGQTSFINFGSFTPSIGEVYYAKNNKGNYQCVQITSTDNNTTDNGALTAQTLYNDCLDCFINNCGVVVMTPCFSQNIIFQVFISGLTFIPDKGEYYCSLLGSYEEGQEPALYEGCFIVEKISLLDNKECNKLISQGNYAIVNPGTTFTAQTDCQTCIANNPRVYEVFLCNSNNPIVSYYINLPLGLESHIISFESNGEQFCGFVQAPAEFVETTGTFISDFGKLSDEISCDTCLDVVSQKILLRDCLDSENEIVVWGSSLYGIGGASNLSTNDGCFEIIGETMSAVTYSGYLDYNPQPDCNSCISCSGLKYTFNISSCLQPQQPPEINYFYSNQILSVGEIFYHPFYGCCSITSISPTIIDSTTFPFYSYVTTFSGGCSDCIDYGDNIVYGDFWTGVVCGDLLNPEIIIFNANFPLSTNSVVKISNGGNDFLCVKINNPYSFADVLTTSLYQAISEYTTCEDCINTVQIGTTLLNCNTGQPKYVSLNQTDWLTATGVYLPFPNQNYYIPYSTVKLSDGNCYNLENPCIIPLTATTGLVTVAEFNLFCGLCSEGYPPRSANTETIFCEQVCISGGSGGYTVVQVVPPHPVWTDSQGTPVTQLNAVTLGGMFGLNS